MNENFATVGQSPHNLTDQILGLFEGWHVKIWNRMPYSAFAIAGIKPSNIFGVSILKLVSFVEAHHRVSIVGPDKRSIDIGADGMFSAQPEFAARVWQRNLIDSAIE